MRRPVVVWVDDPEVTHVEVRPWPALSADEEQQAFSVPVPRDDRLARDMLEAVRIVESSGWSHRHDLAARIRAAFGLDEEEA